MGPGLWVRHWPSCHRRSRFSRPRGFLLMRHRPLAPSITDFHGDSNQDSGWPAVHSATAWARLTQAIQQVAETSQPALGIQGWCPPCALPQPLSLLRHAFHRRDGEHVRAQGGLTEREHGLEAGALPPACQVLAWVAVDGLLNLLP